jgi:hypothetical protein
MQFDPTSLAKFAKGKNKFQAIFLEKNNNWGHLTPPPPPPQKELGCTFKKKNPSMCNLVPFPLLIGYPRTKKSKIKFLMEKNFVRLPQGKHPSMCYLVQFPSSICSREKKSKSSYLGKGELFSCFLKNLVHVFYKHHLRKL